MLDAGTCRDAAEGGATDRMMTRLAAANRNELGGDAAAIRPRWDTDTRGRGIGDGRWIAPAVQHLLAALAAPGWIAEEPDVHLLPHLRQACEAPNSPWTLIAADLQEAVYVVTLEWSRPQPRLHQLRADAVALIGRVAERSDVCAATDDRARDRVSRDNGHARGRLTLCGTRPPPAPPHRGLSTQLDASSYRDAARAGFQPAADRVADGLVLLPSSRASVIAGTKTSS